MIDTWKPTLFKSPEKIMFVIAVKESFNWVFLWLLIFWPEVTLMTNVNVNQLDRLDRFKRFKLCNNSRLIALWYAFTHAFKNPNSGHT